MSNSHKDPFTGKDIVSENVKNSFSSTANQENSDPFIMSKNNPKPTILIIDDDEHVRDALKFIFQKKFNLILCSSGQEGINNISPKVFGVILDIKMEGKNGFDTFIEIKKKNVYLPIIFLTAYQDLKDPLEILNDYRPFGYVIKGADTKLLYDTLDSAVDYYTQIDKNAFLIKALQSKNLALQELRDNLEEKVEQRTQELAVINKDLKKEIQMRKQAELEIGNLLKEKEIILEEVHHRIKNNMTTLKSILSLQSRVIIDSECKNALVEMEYRIESMMVLYEKLYKSVNFESISIKEYTETLVKKIIRNFPNYNSIILELNISEFNLDTKKLQLLGMILNEILTNTMKYSFVDKTEGKIFIEIKLKYKNGEEKDNEIVFVSIHDDGDQLKNEIDLKSSNGFGFRLIELLSKQLNAVLKIDQSKSLKYTLEFSIN